MSDRPSSSNIRPRILLLSAYDAGSHRRWREQLVASQPDFEWAVLSLSPRYFRWRIRGNAVSWLDEPLLQQHWDLILATSMVDLAGLRAFHPALRSVPILLYMHENQFAYPDSGDQHDSIDHQIVTLYSALAADRVIFNSEWNRTSFLDGVDALLRRLPDKVPANIPRRIADRSRVLPVPINDHLFVDQSRALNRQCPHLLWNHRWEYDKGPDRLLALLQRLRRRGQDFRISVVGEQFRRQPDVFAELKARFGEQILEWGFLPDRKAYDALLMRADIVISTALHDFQGLSMLEAMASGCRALAPDRLAYPEYVPDAWRYPSRPESPADEADGAVDLLMQMLQIDSEALSSARQIDSWRLSRLRPLYLELIAWFV